MQKFKIKVLPVLVCLMNHASYLQPALTTSDLCSRSRGQIQIKEVNTLAVCDDLELHLIRLLLLLNPIAS